MPGKLDRVVFIDTTELMSKGKSSVFAADLRRLAQSGSVVTSTLVLDELATNYRKALHKVAGYGHYFPIDRLPDPKNLRQEFVKHLAAAGVVILPVTVALADVISADLQGGKPFKKEGAGYRDFANGATFVDHVKASGAAAGSFLTNNLKDFSDGNSVPSPLAAVAKARGCDADLETLTADEFLKQRLPNRVAAAPAVSQEELDRALEGWLGIVEDGEILGAMQLPGPGPGIELKVVGIRDKEAELLRGPEGGAVQIVFRATFDCIVVADSQLVEARRWRPWSFSQLQPWVTGHQTVRLEWTVEGAFDEKRGVTSVPRQIAALRRLDPATGKPLD